VPGWLQHRDDGITLAVRVQPRAACNELAGLHDERLRIRISAPPVDGAANAELCRFVASLFGVAPARVRLLKGQSGRNKLLVVSGVTVLPEPLARLAGSAASRGSEG
jgi:uncharacterized protein (TIGR00251 family)